MIEHFPNFNNSNIDDYIIGRKIGSGAFSNVWECKKDNDVFAAKITKCELEHFKKEVNILKRLAHDNIIKIYDYYSLKIYPEKKYYCLVTELCECDLYEIMDSLNEAQIKKYIRNILEALVHVHNLSIIHCDIKPENILIKNDTALLADFGLAEYTYTSDTYSRGTVYYKAPELLCGITITEKIDIWAVGCILYELITGDILFNPKKLRNIYNSTSKAEHIIQMIELMGPLPEYFLSGENVDPIFKSPSKYKKIKFNKTSITKRLQKYSISSPDLIDLLEKMLCLDPAQRLSAQECLEHKYLEN